MIDNQFQRIYIFVLAFLMSTMIIIIGFLFFQYKFFCSQAQELILLKQQYYGYIDEIQKKLNGRVPINDEKQDVSDTCIVQQQDDTFDNVVMTAEEFSIAEASDDPDDDEDYVDESFIAINREPDYLKQSTVDYLHTQD